MNVMSILLGLVLAVIVYFVLALFLANWLAAIVGLAVFVASAFGGFGTRSTTTA